MILPTQALKFTFTSTPWCASGSSPHTPFPIPLQKISPELFSWTFFSDHHFLFSLWSQNPKFALDYSNHHHSSWHPHPLLILPALFPSVLITFLCTLPALSLLPEPPSLFSGTRLVLCPGIMSLGVGAGAVIPSPSVFGTPPVQP